MQKNPEERRARIAPLVLKEFLVKLSRTSLKQNLTSKPSKFLMNCLLARILTLKRMKRLLLRKVLCTMSSAMVAKRCLSLVSATNVVYVKTLITAASVKSVSVTSILSLRFVSPDNLLFQ